MPTRTTSAPLAFAVTALAFALAGCVDELPPATTPAITPATVGSHEVPVTIVRPVSRCDTGEYAIVIDERGHFIGNIAAGTKLSVAMERCHHALSAWSNVDLHVDRVVGFNPVAAVKVDATGHEPRYVTLEVSEPCQYRATFDMHSVAETDKAWGDVSEWLARATLVTADQAAGQARLDAKPAHLRSMLEFGATKLERNREVAARNARFEAIQLEDREK
jgi:hypothetical protein